MGMYMCMWVCRCLWSPAGGAEFGMFVSWWLVWNPRVFCKTHACSQPWVISPSPYRCVPLRWLLQSIAQMLVCFPVSQTGYYPDIYLTKSTGEWWSDNLLDHGNGDMSHQDMQILRYTNTSDWTLEMYAVYLCFDAQWGSSGLVSVNFIVRFKCKHSEGASICRWSQGTNFIGIEQP